MEKIDPLGRAAESKWPRSTTYEESDRISTDATPATRPCHRGQQQPLRSQGVSNLLCRPCRLVRRGGAHQRRRTVALIPRRLKVDPSGRRIGMPLRSRKGS